MFTRLIAPVTLVLASLLALAGPAQAQRINPARIIDLHLNVESDNQSFSGSVVEGQGFRVTLAGVGSFEVMPVQVSAGNYVVSVLRGPVGAEPEDLRQVETVNAREGVAVRLRSMGRVGLVIEGSRVNQRTAMVVPASFSYARAVPRATADRCCVTCGNVTACACAVKSECGYCCVAPCCPDDEITLEGRFFPRARQFAARTCGNPIRDEERLFTPAAEAQEARIATRG